MGWMSDERGLEKCKANYVPLSPLSFLQRAATVYENRTAIVYGNLRYDYGSYYARVSRAASAFQKAGVCPGDVVATILPNVPAQMEAHFSVPAAGAILSTINTRLDAGTISYILSHGEARLVLVDTEFLNLAETALEQMKGPRPEIIEVADPAAGFAASGKYQDYETLLSTGDPAFEWIFPEDEWESICLNYTSGTTGRPKGVVYHHRGGYLMALGTTAEWRGTEEINYLAIVPMFHCNGWNHSWMLPIFGGTMHCLRAVSAAVVFKAIAEQKINRFGGAPIVLNMLVNASDDEKRDFDHPVRILTAGAPPPAATLQKMAAMGFEVTHVYGLTETYGHVTQCIARPEWDALSPDLRAEHEARQGVSFPIVQEITVHDTSGKAVARDGTSQGEIMIRGNTVMKGYLKNPEATKEAFSGGYFCSGDLAVQHADSYIQISDRAKDIIISGGENVSSVEIEGVLMRHDCINLCAVVARPDEKWGEVPLAFVELKQGRALEEVELIAFARKHLAGFKTPKKIVFCELPKTSTGKIQKFILREKAAAL